ncbi:HutD family protein [Pseudomonas sp. sp1636]|uniref:HutD/Ves family protein n=1 Tax=Pseudomonas sp. sp1636 TaxID=3036707 RepID=UPI0025A5A99A|nr:HutD family protein [Pseudomonas sp. sp1636]MDM8348338.1 HutD family protein [Pseudomonas sp. sp1636]
MSQIHLHRAADYPRMPWKNGGGSTLEIARDQGEGLEGFGWRLSLADIGESGGFSAFAGYQRIITVLEGAGMQLQVDGVPSRPLLPFDPFAFSGDSRVQCQLLAGAIRDFNLIYAPQRYRVRLQWLALARSQRLFSSASTLLLFGAVDALQVTVDDADCALLGRYDCLQIERAIGLVELQLAADTPGACCLIELIAL